MKPIISLLLIIVIANSCPGQTLDALQKKGDSLYKAKDFRNAALTFTVATKLVPANQPGTIFRYRLSASRCWALANSPDSAFAQLNRIATIKHLVYNNLIVLTTDRDLTSLHKDPRWAALNKELFDVAIKDCYSPVDSTYTLEEIIYGRKYGMALTMLQLKPTSKTNGKAIIQIRSGGWGSSFYMPGVSEAKPFLQNGYTVFIVFHGSEPVYTVVDAIEDLQRAVRFIRYTAKSYSLDANKIGVMGSSAGGHLALMCGLSDSTSVAYSPDPVDRVSSKVQAVVSFSPTVDFLNWDGKGNNASSAFLFKELLVHVLEFRKWDKERRRFTYVTDSGEINKILKQISPTYHVSSNDAAVMVLHGDRDELVPIQQTELLVKKLQDAKVPVSFTVKKGAGHGWPKTDDETQMVLTWFSKHL